MYLLCHLENRSKNIFPSVKMCYLWNIQRPHLMIVLPASDGVLKYSFYLFLSQCLNIPQTIESLTISQM